MLFSWQAKNRQFKKKSRCAGQAVPILLLCIAGVVIAVFTTKIIGNSNIAQTAASNAADSGSLSAASCWAGSLNRLVYRNWNQNSDERDNGPGHQGVYMGYSTVPDNYYYYYKEMNKYYTDMRNIYNQVYLDGVTYINQAQENATLALNLCIEARALMVLGEDCTVWDNYKTASEKLVSAVGLLEQAAFAVGAFHVDTYYMREIGNFFWSNQQEHMCKAMEFMDQNYERAIRTGQFYALSNSSYQAADPDDFNFWLGGRETSNFNLGASPTVTYPPAGGEGSISVTMKTPDKPTYKMSMANWNYPKKHDFKSVPFCHLNIDDANHSGDVWGIESSKDLSTDLRAVVQALIQQANWALTVYLITLDAAQCCDCFEPVSSPLCIVDCCHKCYPPKYKQARDLSNNYLVPYQDCINRGLNIIVNEAGGGDGVVAGPDTIPRLKNWNDWIMNNFWSPPGGGVEDQIATTCADVRGPGAYCDANCDAPGMQIVNIKEAILSDWEVTCDISSAAAKKSKSKFWGDNGGRGENVGQNWSPPVYPDYYPEITGS